LASAPRLIIISVIRSGGVGKVARDVLTPAYFDDPKPHLTRPFVGLLPVGPVGILQW
jgi:hypothetical protein